MYVDLEVIKCANKGIRSEMTVNGDRIGHGNISETQVEPERQEDIVLK